MTVRPSFLASALFIVAALAMGCAQRAEDVPAGNRAGATSASTPTTSAPARRNRENFVGSKACAPCHRAQSDAYFGSHHAKALVAPSPELAKARFDGSHFESKLGKSTKFALRGGASLVTTPGANGKAQTFPIAYVSGVWPLEQYVVATERGKLQSLSVVWDSRSAAEGGNKWFHVYGAAGVAPSDALYFTSAAQNWNHVCADCHSTRVERRYDTRADSFDTRWAESSVGCVACHGPGADHVRSAQAGLQVAPLAVRLKRSEPWSPSATGSPTPRPRDSAEVEVCASCHSRREPLAEGFIASDPFLDSFEPELLRPGRYHADGQVEGEVYEWASFLQSRMHASGVRCSDCHEPHSGQLFAQGNALCVRCHEPRRFDVEAHSHHPAGNAPLCVDCHMPPSTFMQIDERRDHSLRIPRPDYSVEFGTPNACNGCHTKQSAQWARDSVTKWYPASSPRRHFVEALGRDRKGALDAPRALRTLVDDAAVPAIARATALERLGDYPGSKTALALRRALTHSEPLVVYGAVLGAAQLPPQERAPLLVPALGHGTRLVRIAAGKALAGVPVEAGAQAALERAFAEVERSFDVSASRAESHVERSAFELARGKLAEAEASLQTALRLSPCLVEAQLNLAELQRQRGDEAEAERAVRAALACDPRSAAAHHALGLWLVRARQTKAAISSLKKAAQLAPGDSRFSYVLAVALAGNGERDEAIRVLRTTLEHRPNDANALQALASYLRQAGQLEQADEVRRKLETLRRD